MPNENIPSLNYWKLASRNSSILSIRSCKLSSTPSLDWSFAPLSPSPILPWQGALSAAETRARHGARDGFLGSRRGDANAGGHCSRNRDRQMLLHFKGSRALWGFQEYAQIDRLLSNTKHICSSVRQLFPEDGGRARPLTAIRAGWGTCGGSRRSASPACGANAAVLAELAHPGFTKCPCVPRGSAGSTLVSFSLCQSNAQHIPR